jgi:DNA modification methylase
VSVSILRGNALALPLPDNSVDLVVTSPPYFGLRSYQDGGEHYDGQIGDEATPAEFVDALIAATAEMVRVVKPSGSIWVNLGDKYAGGGGQWEKDERPDPNGLRSSRSTGGIRGTSAGGKTYGLRPKSLIGIPWRYALRCIDELGLILRAEVIWSKPNGLPESVTDRVRRSHEVWFHFTLSPRYYSAVDEIREGYEGKPQRRGGTDHQVGEYVGRNKQTLKKQWDEPTAGSNPLGKLPGSVWTIPTEPLHVPDHLGVDHFAAYPTEFPRRIIQGWSPRGVCVECGEGRRPVVEREASDWERRKAAGEPMRHGLHGAAGSNAGGFSGLVGTITGEACACPEPTAPTRPGTVLDPFGGTGTTALVADALGRHGISLDMSADYCRLAGWRTNDPKQRAKAARREYTPPREQTDGQLDLLEGLGA